MRTFAIGLLGIVLVHGSAVAQTPQEQDRILRMFQQSVETAAITKDPRVFTLPVATVFRQVIAKTLDEQPHASRLAGVGAEMPLAHHPVVLEPFPATELHEFPALLARALPPLPPELEYRLIGNDLVLRAVGDDVIVAVLRDAVGRAVTTQR